MWKVSWKQRKTHEKYPFLWGSFQWERRLTDSLGKEKTSSTQLNERKIDEEGSIGYSQA